MEATSDACERAKGIDEYQHIVDNTNVELDSLDSIREVVADVLKEREKNNMSAVRATVVLSTTSNVNKLSKDIRDTIRDLNKYCQRQHTATHSAHRCSVEVAKGPMVPAMDTPDKVLAHLSDAQQAHFEPLRKAREEMNGVYNAFTSAGVNGSMTLRDINDKELKQVDSERVKA